MVGDGSCLSAISALSGAAADVKLAEYDSLTFGSFALYSLSTPGHTAVGKICNWYTFPYFIEECVMC